MFKLTDLKEYSTLLDFCRLFNLFYLKMQQDKKKLFIGNLAYETTVEALVEFASAFGKIVDSYKPFGKGFGFLTFETEEMAAAALEGLNGKTLDGRELKADYAQPREDKPRRDFGGRRDFRSGGNDRGGFRRDRRF